MRRHKTPALNPCSSSGVESTSWHLTPQANTPVTETYCHRGKKAGGATAATVPSFVAKLPFVSIPISKISFLFSRHLEFKYFSSRICPDELRQILIKTLFHFEQGNASILSPRLQQNPEGENRFSSRPRPPCSAM